MSTFETVPQRIRTRVGEHAQRPFTYAKDASGTFQTTSFSQTWRTVATLGRGLMEWGVSRGDHIGIISHNREEWINTDLAIMGIGAADVPRGSDSTADEVAFILNHADCKIVFVENALQCEKVLSKRSELPALERIVLFEPYPEENHPPEVDGITIRDYSQLYATGEAFGEEGRRKFEHAVDEGHGDELATILYTSGTTGEPKGVMLPHRSFIFQIDRLYHILHLNAGDIFMTVLPVWHAFERAVEYIALNYGAALAYSKPIGKIMLTDMATLKPMWMTSVPRIWEGVRTGILRTISKQSPLKQALFHFFLGVSEIHFDLSTAFFGRLPHYQKRIRLLDAIAAVVPLALITPFHLLGQALVFSSIRDRLGGRFVAGVSGGGALPPHIDKFFQAAGILILEGYGLTETGPVLAVRDHLRPVPGTVGALFPDVEYKVLDEQGNEVGPGIKGELVVRSPQVMLGYYKRPQETAKVLSEDGWLHTGDLVVFTYEREFRVVGRTKDTIVLLGGENVEPAPIEEALLRSNYIDQAMVVGQDQKFLGALIHLDEELVQQFAVENEIEYVEYEELLGEPRLREVITTEIKRLVCAKTGFKTFEQVFRVHYLIEPFEVGRELTQTLKVKRAVATHRYSREIEHLFE